MAKTYLPGSNTAGAFYPGVPLGDLSTAVFNALPAWLQAAINGATIYQDVS